MSGPIEVRSEPKSENPGLLLLYGAKKAGKTTMLGELDDCLIIDTENGANFIKGHIAAVNSLLDTRDLCSHLIEKQVKGETYKYIAIDTLNKVVEWIEESIVTDYNATNSTKIQYFGDLAFGKGHGMVRNKVDKLIETFRALADTVILIGHNKLASAITENSTIVDPASLDLTGKLKNMIMAKCDSIGFVFRNDENELCISFEANKALEAGSRSPHLKGKVMPFKWDDIFLK